MFGGIHLWSHLVLTFVCWEFFYYWFNFITGNWSVHILYFTWFSLGRVYISKNLSSSSRLSILLAYIYIVFHSSLLPSFVFLWCWLYIFLFHFWFYWFGPCPFFSWWVWLKVYQLCLSFHRIILASLSFSIVFLISISFISALIFMISFLLLLWVLFVLLL